MPDFDGNPLTRPPKGFSAESPALDLLLCRQWAISATLPPATALVPGLPGEVITRFHAAAPFVALLNAPFARAPRRPLF